MKLEVTVSEIADIFKEIQERPEQLFEMIRLDIREVVGKYLTTMMNAELTIGRTLMGNPELILLDEPVEGLAPLIVKDFSEKLTTLKEMGVTILFSEQNIRFSLAIADRAYVINKGRIEYEGTIEDLSRNEEIKQKYLMI